MLEFMQKGGVLMIPITICSILALGIVIERLFNLRTGRIIRYDLLTRVENLLRERKISEATTICKKYPAPMTRILLAAILNHDKEKDEIKDLIEDAGRHEGPTLDRYLTILGTIAVVAPLLGLTGTVTGMMRAFTVISLHGTNDPAALAGGIYEALITTVAGLLVAIPTYIFHSYFQSKSDAMAIEMEKSSLKMLNILKRD